MAPWRVGGIGKKVFTLLLLVLATGSLAAQTGKIQLSTGSDWWKHAVVYEVYPRSFMDSNGDGVGDLKGITSRLDYFLQLGVDTIWIAPMYPSPQVDFGYDISNYEAIDPQYGTMADFEELVKQANRRGLHIVLDAVMNHTSDRHPWFLESKSSRTNPKADWYVWADGKDGGPPNNWTSGFGGSAWKYVPERRQFYYHNFYAEQPDLNWRNPAVRAAMESMLRFWLDKGVSGFRLDAILVLFEDPSLKDAPVLGGKNAYGDLRINRSQMGNQPEVHDVLKELRTLVDERPNHPVLIGEDYLTTATELRKMYGPQHDELQLPMDMQLGFINKLDPAAFAKAIREGATELGGNQPLYVFDNHDKQRSWERYGDGVHNAAIARLIATILLTTQATPMLYEGQELGMKTSTPASKEEVRDPIGIKGWPNVKGRDGERTPMQWDDTRNAGFSRASKTWLPVQADFKTINVASESADPGSLLNWYKELLRTRKTDAGLATGSTEVLPVTGNVLAFTRGEGDDKTWVVCNFRAEAASFALPTQAKATTLMSNDAVLDKEKVELGPYGVWVGKSAEGKK